MKKVSKTQIQRAEAIFREARGILKTTEAMRLGIHPVTLYSMRDAGVVENISRGLYRLVSSELPGNLDLVAAIKRVPHAVVCLISALSFHGLTTQIPRDVSLAIKKGVKKPRVEYPPLHFFWFSKKTYDTGIEIHTFNGTKVHIYSPEKSIADAFKFRSSVGLDVALEALKMWKSRKKANISQLMGLAKVCRVEKIIKPYLEALI